MNANWFAGVVCAAVCLTVGLAPAQALAQRIGRSSGMGRTEMEGTGTNVLHERLLERYAATLRMDQEQLAAAKTLLAGYLTEARAVDERINAAIEAMQPEPDEITFKAISQKMPEFYATAKRELDAAAKSLLEDIRILLRPEQQARWPLLERQRRRESQIGVAFGLIGGVSGSGIDMIAFVERLRMPATEVAKLDELLEAYAVEVDSIVRGERALQEEKAQLAAEAQRTGKYDASGSDAQAARTRARGIALRNMNKRYARQVSELLDEEWKAKFEEAYRLRAMPPIYKESATHRGLDVAAQWNDLTPAQKEAIVEMRGQYLARLGPLNARWAVELFNAETDGLDVMVPITQFPQESPAVAAAHDDRRRLDAEFAERLAGKLSAEQQARLPQPRPMRNMFFGGIKSRAVDDDMGD